MIRRKRTWKRSVDANHSPYTWNTYLIINSTCKTLRFENNRDSRLSNCILISLIFPILERWKWRLPEGWSHLNLQHEVRNPKKENQGPWIYFSKERSFTEVKRETSERGMKSNLWMRWWRLKTCHSCSNWVLNKADFHCHEQVCEGSLINLKRKVVWTHPKRTKF